ncbi:hypothetical protein V8E36_001444 [Tilletia maclaganii]
MVKGGKTLNAADEGNLFPSGSPVDASLTEPAPDAYNREIQGYVNRVFFQRRQQSASPVISCYWADIDHYGERGHIIGFSSVYDHDLNGDVLAAARYIEPVFGFGLDPITSSTSPFPSNARSQARTGCAHRQTKPTHGVETRLPHACLLANNLSLVAGVAYWTLSSGFGAARTLGEEYVNAIMVESGSGVTSRTISPHRSICQRPAELLPKYTTVECTLSRPAQVPRIFLNVFDSRRTARDSGFSLLLLPANAFVGLITFGTIAQTHQFGYDQCPKSSVFRGTKEYAPKQIQKMLGFTAAAAANAPRPGAPGPSQAVPAAAGGQPLGAARLLLPVAQCEFQLTNILEHLQRDPWPVANDKRAQGVAVSKLETSFPNAGPRVMLSVGGPPTEGPGCRLDRAARAHCRIRSHHDIEKDNVKFYEMIAKRAAPNGHTIE